MNRILSFVAMACLAADLSSLCFAQDHATGGSNKLSREEWQSRVNATRERLDQRREELRREREKLLGLKQVDLNRKERIEPKRDELRRERENKGGDFQPLPQVGSTIDPARFSMPSADTAGVQAGVTLTNYTGPMTITTPGAVIENVIINGTLTVAADNVTIKNCIVQNFSNWGILSDNAVNTRVEYCTIDGSGSSRTTGLGVGGGTNSAIIGCDIKGMTIAINMFGAALVKDNYIHDLNDMSNDPAARHFDGIRAMVSGADIEHNTIMMPDRDGGTAAVFINTELPDAPGPIDNVKVIDNLMTGDASYTVYVTRGEGAVTNVIVENNYVERGMYGYFNVDASPGLTPPTPTIRNNVLWDNQKNPIPYPKR